MKNEERFEEALRSALSDRSAPGGQCLSEEKVVSYVAGRMPEAEQDDLREHLAHCGECVALVRDARSFLDAMDPHQKARQASRTPWPLLLAASLALAAAGGLLILRLPRPERERPGEADRRIALLTAVPDPHPWRNLRIPAAAYVPTVSTGEDLVFRSGEEDVTQPLDAFRTAMEPYAAGDFARAEKALATFLAERPNDARANFYRGVALTQLGRYEEASGLLDAALTHDEGRNREETLWYRGLLRLKEGRFAEALSDLDAVAASAGPRQKEAESLRSQVRARVER